jgi:hypothetical protein
MLYFVVESLEYMIHREFAVSMLYVSVVLLSKATQQ